MWGRGYSGDSCKCGVGMLVRGSGKNKTIGKIAWGRGKSGVSCKCWVGVTMRIVVTVEVLIRVV